MSSSTGLRSRLSTRAGSSSSVSSASAAASSPLIRTASLPKRSKESGVAGRARPPSLAPPPLVNGGGAPVGGGVVPGPAALELGQFAPAPVPYSPCFPPPSMPPYAPYYQPTAPPPALQQSAVDIEATVRRLMAEGQARDRDRDRADAASTAACAAGGFAQALPGAAGDDDGAPTPPAPAPPQPPPTATAVRAAAVERSLWVLSLNARALTEEKLVVRRALDELTRAGRRPDVICLQETWGTEASERRFALEGYRMFAFSRRPRRAVAGRRSRDVRGARRPELPVGRFFDFVGGAVDRARAAGAVAIVAGDFNVAGLESTDPAWPRAPGRLGSAVAELPRCALDRRPRPHGRQRRRLLARGGRDAAVGDRASEIDYVVVDAGRGVDVVSCATDGDDDGPLVDMYGGGSYTTDHRAIHTRLRVRVLEARREVAVPGGACAGARRTTRRGRYAAELESRLRATETARRRAADVDAALGLVLDAIQGPRTRSSASLRAGAVAAPVVLVVDARGRRLEATRLAEARRLHGIIQTEILGRAARATHEWDAVRAAGGSVVRDAAGVAARLSEWTAEMHAERRDDPRYSESEYARLEREHADWERFERDRECDESLRSAPRRARWESFELDADAGTSRRRTDEVRGYGGRFSFVHSPAREELRLTGRVSPAAPPDLAVSIPIGTEGRYLGVVLAHDGSWSKHVRAAATEMRRQVASATGALATVGSMKRAHLLTAHVSYARSVVAWSAAAWGKVPVEASTAVRQAETEAFRFALGAASTGVSHVAMATLLGEVTAGVRLLRPARSALDHAAAAARCPFRRAVDAAVRAAPAAAAFSCVAAALDACQTLGLQPPSAGDDRASGARGAPPSGGLAELRDDLARAFASTFGEFFVAHASEIAALPPRRST
ncbi:hypothetical protein JL720_12968 [Aureococcus anophagefferens]|nr:hypothetical protein JL720_12968 [Aureococcus anophagefferens]